MHARHVQAGPALCPPVRRARAPSERRRPKTAVGGTAPRPHRFFSIATVNSTPPTTLLTHTHTHTESRYGAIKKAARTVYTRKGVFYGQSYIHASTRTPRSCGPKRERPRPCLWRRFPFPKSGFLRRAGKRSNPAFVELTCVKRAYSHPASIR